jgi:hypothetical protein
VLITISDLRTCAWYFLVSDLCCPYSSTENSETGNALMLALRIFSYLSSLISLCIFESAQVLILMQIRQISDPNLLNLL